MRLVKRLCKDVEKFRNAFAICSDTHRWARLIRLGGRAPLRVSIYGLVDNCPHRLRRQACLHDFKDIGLYFSN